MKQIKHLLFLSILCSLVLFTNCGEDSEDPVADDTTDTTGDDSTPVLDADGDGVADADDTCADTPSGEAVDSSGCAVVVVSAEIGDALQGGIVFYLLQEGDSGYVAGEVHGFITTMEDQTTEDGAEWGCNGTEISGADGTAVGTGAQNTLDILAGCSEDGIAAKLASDYEVTEDGVIYDDWFLPSKDELKELYFNRLELPSYGNLMVNYYYFSSTEYDGTNAWGHHFGNDSQVEGSKNTLIQVRAIRSF